jgi:membrane protein implicated in regulation of membrane protease activity
MNWAAISWLVLMVVFLMIEGTTVAMVSSWFAVGSAAAMIASLLGATFLWQLVVFFAVSCVLLALLRPLVRKFIAPKITKTNVDAIIGKQGLVTTAINNVTATGQVKLGSMEWTARSTSGTPIETGTLVKVDRIEGVKVFVTPVEVTTPV